METAVQKSRARTVVVDQFRLKRRNATERSPEQRKAKSLHPRRPRLDQVILKIKLTKLPSLIRKAKGTLSRNLSLMSNSGRHGPMTLEASECSARPHLKLS